MAGYVIADVEITDREKYAEYVEVVPPTISAHGGRFLVRGGNAEKLEGDWTPKRIVILEFDTMEDAKRWWASEDYKAPKALRQSASVANMIVVESM